MKIAVYPGSFDPWHEGHEDVLNKALKVFDEVVIAFGGNGEKQSSIEFSSITLGVMRNPRVKLTQFKGFLVDFVENKGYCAIIRGLRNGSDLQYEMNMQYTNEDLGLEIPIVYFITDRKLSHISSSMVREVNRIRELKL